MQLQKGGLKKFMLGGSRTPSSAKTAERFNQLSWQPRVPFLESPDN